MSVKLSNKAKIFIIKNNICNILLDVSYFTEGCVLIKEPKIEIIKSNKDLRDFEEYDQIKHDSLNLYISNDFKQIFPQKEEFLLELGGTIKKKIIIKNIQPQIIRTCQVDK